MNDDTYLSIRHGDILAEAMDISHKFVWENLVDFVIFGPPDRQYDSDKWQLHECYSLLTYLKEQTQGQVPGSEYTRVADFLKTDIESVRRMEDRSSRVGGPTSSMEILCNRMLKTARLYFKKITGQSIPIDHKPRKIDIQPRTWCWNILMDRPCYVLKVYWGPRTGTTFGPNEVRVDILVQRMGFDPFTLVTDGTGPSLDKTVPDVYAAIFEKQTVGIHALAKIITNPGELEI